jgi:phosphoglycolate phosphatase-like HAD superfamily hydrolase
MQDRYLELNESVKRLVSDYKKHNSLFVAFDFDNTVFDYFGTGETYPKLEALLRFLKVKEFKLILFTGNEGEKLQEIVKYCKEHGYEPDFVNESPVMKTTKPYYNILLDDRAGLNDAYQTLVLTLNILNYDYKY